MKRFTLLFLMFVWFSSIVNAQTAPANVCTLPATYTFDQEVTWYFDLTGNSMVTAGENLYFWSWTPQNLPTGRAILTYQKDMLWSLTFTPTLLYGVDLQTIIDTGNNAFWCSLQNEGGSSVTGTIPYAQKELLRLGNQCFCVGIPSQNDNIFLINFGNSPISNPDANSKNWTNVQSKSAVYQILDINNLRRYDITTSGDFIPNNNSGFTTPDANLLGELAISNATASYMYLSTGTGTVTLSCLNPNRMYRFSILGSRNFNGVRQTKYTITGFDTQTGIMQTSGAGIASNPTLYCNDDELFTVEIFPDAFGIIQILVEIQSGGFAYINALKMEELASTTWNGSAWNYRAPDNTKNAILAGNYAGNGFECNDLTINENTVLEIPSLQTVTVNGNLLNNGTISLKSDNSSTQASGALLNKGSLVNNGNMNAEKFIDIPHSLKNGNWYFVGSPVDNSIAVEAVFMNDYVYQYTQSTPFWENLVFGINTINNGKGYLAQTINPLGKNLVFSGTFQSGNFDYTLSALGDKWNLIANPFPSPIDLEKIELTNASNYFYIWDLTSKNYKIYVKGNPGLSTASQYIKSMEGFFAGASGANKIPHSVLTFTNESRVSNSVFQSKSPKNEISVLRLSVNSIDDAKDQVVIGFKNEEFEIAKMFSFIPSAPQIYFAENDKYSSIKIFSDPETERIVPMNFESEQDGQFQIVVENYPSSISILLFDRLENVFINMNENETYSFSHSINNEKHRFDLYFNPQTTQIETEIVDFAHVFSQQNTIFIEFKQTEQSQISIFDLTGKKIFDKPIFSQNQQISNLKTGIYFVKIEQNNKFLTRKVFIH